MKGNGRILTLILMVCALTSWLPASALDATGIVFNDRNNNGIRDARERGVPGILVSNGVDVVETDSAGRYSVPVDGDATIFIIKPRGWMTSIAPADNVPRFCYVHRPAGSPPTKYPGVAPTGPLPPSIDFPLHRQRERDRFRVVCMGDTQTRNIEEVGFLAHDIVDPLVGVDAAFGVTLGDVVFNDLTVFDPMAKCMGRIGIPWRHVPGNHDRNADAATPDQAYETFGRVFGPSYYAFNYGPVHFIVLSDVRDEPQKDGYHGGLGPKQLAFIENDLRHVSPKQRVVLMMHIPITELEDRNALFAILSRFPHTFSLSAHTHDQRHVFVGAADGWRQATPHHHLIHATACGSWWGGTFDETGIPETPMSDGVPNGYSFITFDKTNYSVDFRPARWPADYQLRAFTADSIPAYALGNAAVSVNVFAGSERSTVEMRADDSAQWTKMDRYDGKDFCYVRLHARQKTLIEKCAKGQEISEEINRQIRRELHDVIRGLPEPSDTPHLWKAYLPPGLASGPHTLHVRTKDMFGHCYTTTRVFNVE